MKMMKGRDYGMNVEGRIVDPRQWMISEKFDGWRARWTGTKMTTGVTDLAWPHADSMPDFPVDGELWIARGQFEKLAKMRSNEPDFEGVVFVAFDAPNMEGTFAERYAVLKQYENSWMQVANQTSLSDLMEPGESINDAVHRLVSDVVNENGEGLMAHHRDSQYLDGRTDRLLKLKPTFDEEVTVIEHVPGSGRHEGRMGALKVRDNTGRVYNVGTGFTDAERDEPPAVGVLITVAYKGRTTYGNPRHPAYVRVRDAA